jgi:hypothetical protein
MTKMEYKRQMYQNAYEQLKAASLVAGLDLNKYVLEHNIYGMDRRLEDELVHQMRIQRRLYKERRIAQTPYRRIGRKKWCIVIRTMLREPGGVDRIIDTNRIKS